jgi:hypothetical protein
MAKANFCAAKQACKKPNLAKQSFAQLSKKLDKLEKTIKKASHKSKKRCRDNSNSNREYEIGLDSTRKLGLNIEKAFKRSTFTFPSPIKATPSESASDSNVVSDQKIASNQDIALRATSDQAILHNSEILSNPATLSNLATLCDFATLSDPTMPSDPATFGNPLTFINADAIMLMSPSKSKDEHVNNSTLTTSNPTEGRTTTVIAVMRGNPMWVLSDSGYDGDLIFVNKD